MTKQLRLTSSDIFNSPFFKSTVGFDRLFNDLDRVFETTKLNSYPPYNVARITDNDQVSYEIVLAVAGFEEEDIDITLENDHLHIAGESRSLDYGEAYEYLHKGIAERKFVRTFPIAKNIEVRSAKLQNGLLKITLDEIVPEELKPKRIEINKR